MKYRVFGIKDTTAKYNKIFENDFRNEGVAIHLCNFGRYLILLKHFIYNNIFALEMMFIEMSQQNEEDPQGPHLLAFRFK